MSLEEHIQLTRRYLLKLGAAGATAWAASPLNGNAQDRPANLQKAIEQLESWLTPAEDFRDVSRGRPVPHTLSEEERAKVGLTRDTWRLEVLGDPENPTLMKNPLTREKGTEFNFEDLMRLAETKAVRFAKVMTCLNIGCPLGTGIWEGVPLRELLWLTQPAADLRRVFYYGFHNGDPKQRFQSSLSASRVLEDPFDLPPVILCYKLNGEWLSPERGGPVRVVVPEAYGFKSVKWLTTVMLTNLFHANDTYANGNNDVDSPLKTFSATLSHPDPLPTNEPFAMTGYAQVGVSGLDKVQVWLQPADREWPKDDPYFLTAPWIDAQILGPPKQWGGDIADGRIPADTLGFDEEGRPQDWPLQLAKVHWAVLHPEVPAGNYILRSRTIDTKQQPQPLPRPFQKSGHSALERIRVSAT